jgi:hypothetical protein
MALAAFEMAVLPYHWLTAGVTARYTNELEAESLENWFLHQ